MPHVIIKGSPFVNGGSGKEDWGQKKDELHKERKQLETDIRESGIFSKDQMMQRDCHDTDEEQKRVVNYIKWKETKKDGKTNEDKMRRWCDINREFKKHGEEGKVQNPDNLRERKLAKYD